MSGEVRVGTASWSDPGFVEDWYPQRLPPGERLQWYAARFNLVEVNSSFYAIPSARLVQRWCDQTPADFVFDVKLFRLLSRHATAPDLLPRDLRARAAVKDGKVRLTPELERAVARRFREAVAPFLEQGKLGALLLQLSPAFSPRTHRLAELEDLLEDLADCPLAVEFRHREWVTGDQLEPTTRFLRQRGITLVSVDAPPAEHFMIMPAVDVVTNPALGYLRCHGRNTRGYLRGRSVAERFDYFYDREELRELAGRAAKLAGQTAAVHVIFNNNTSNYAPVNAGEFREILQQEFPDLSVGPAPPARLRTQEMDLGALPRRRPGRFHPAAK